VFDPSCAPIPSGFPPAPIGGIMGMSRPQKITFAEMRSSGVRGLLVYCADYKCSPYIAITGDRWADDVRLSDL
jgi:hypothetical protein